MSSLLRLKQHLSIFAIAVALLTAGALSSTIAYADTFATYNLNATLVGGGSVVGTLTFDTTTGQGTSSNVLATGGGSSVTFTGPALLSGQDYYVIYFPSSASFSAYLGLVLPVTPSGTISDFTSGSICSVSYSTNCLPQPGPSQFRNYSPDQIIQAQSGTLTLAATPEPSSIVLLGSGILGLAGAARRRFFR